MARSRNIKPKFFRDSKVVACSFEARLLFQGLWCLADYMGRLVYDPVDIKMEVFPGDDVNIPSMMDELESNRLIQTYTDDSGRTLVQVLKFSRHQYPHKNERVDSKGNPQPHLPGPDDVKQENGASEPEKQTEEQQVTDAIRVLREYYQSDPADSLNLIPDSLKLIPFGEGAPDDAPPKAKKPDKGCKIPDNFPGEAELQWARENEPSVDAKREALKFRNYWLAKTGKDATKKDWRRTWQNWVMRAFEMQGGRGGPSGESAGEKTRREAREWRERHVVGGGV